MMASQELIETRQAYQRLLSVGRMLRDQFKSDGECIAYLVESYPPDNQVLMPCGVCERCIAVQSWDAVASTLVLPPFSFTLSNQQAPRAQ